ncbi:protein a6 isoform X2 [Eurosta solidaginis]|uniref:protein a6 isoform X2 n=1 Tax=Eurosta solidaginis TaxID=178769 RepID=UPI0035315B70
MSENTAPIVDANSAVIVTPKPSSNNLSITHKNSGPFYISPSLFDNKRLRRKRLRWAKALLAAAGIQQHHILQRYKTERRKQNLAKLPANVTIDLLSDDEDAKEKSSTVSKDNSLKLSNAKPVINKMPTFAFNNGPPPLVPISNLHSTPTTPQLYVCSGQAIEVSKVPNITLIPVQNLQNIPATSTPIAQVAPMPRRNVKRKRKSQQPKRHEQPTIVNNESIVLSDDSDNEKCAVATSASVLPPHTLKDFKNTNNGLLKPLLSVVTPPIVPLSTTITPTLAQKSPKLQTPANTPPQPSAPTYPTMLSPYSAQVDEDVTVSLVPRSSAASTCPKSNTNELFPMLPDETTVHTVIANRTYELSLTKLREGLASCGMPEFSNGQQKGTTTKRKGPTPPMVSPTPPPISLKLSSDLSISLISDDDEDDPEQLQRERLAAESLLQKQPQLMVQHLQLPAVSVLPAGANVSVVTAPRRRKLG